ncbi:unnamed protein product [Caenorhabditis nigoni]
MTFTDTFAQILQFIISIVSPSFDGLATNPEALPGAEKEHLYRERMRMIFQNLPIALRDTFFLTKSVEMNCADLSCERSFGHIQTGHCPTLMLELTSQKTVQSLLDNLQMEKQGECGWEDCKGNIKKTTTLGTSSFLIIENLNEPSKRGVDGNNSGNTMITIGNNTYYLKGLVYKKNGCVVVVRDTEGGAMPAPGKWYYAIYQNTNL